MLFLVRPEKPAVSSDASSNKVDDGGSVTFTCTGSNLPTSGVSYVWKKDNGDIQNEQSITYTISKVDFDDAGQYSCLVKVNNGLSDESDKYSLAGKS